MRADPKVVKRCRLPGGYGHCDTLAANWVDPDGPKTDIEMAPTDDQNGCSKGDAERRASAIGGSRLIFCLERRVRVVR